MAKEFVIYAYWDADAGVWTARSDDVPGLSLEAATFEALVDRLKVVVPELLELNGVVQKRHEIPLSVLAEFRERIAV